MSSVSCHIEPLAQMTGHKSAVFALLAAVGGAGDNAAPATFYAGDGDGWIVQWDIQKPDLGMALAKVPANIFSLCLKQEDDGPKMAAGTLTGDVFFLDLARGAVPVGNLKFSKAVFGIVCYADRWLFACGGGQLYSMACSDTKVQSAGTEHIPANIDGVQLGHDNLRCIAPHLTQPIAAVASSNGLVYIISLPDLSLLDVLSFHKNSVFCLAFSPCGNYLLSGSRDAQIAVWKYEEKQTAFALHHHIPAHWFTVNGIAYSPDGQFFASASRDKTIKIWDARTFQLLKVIDTAKFGRFAPTRSVNTLAWLPDSAPKNILIAAGDDRNVSAWEVI